MKKNVKIYLDYLPLVILFICAISLVRAAGTSETLLQKRHYVGLAFLALTIILFFVRHLFGILFLGLTLLFGLVGVLSYSPTILTTAFGLGPSEK